MSRFELEALNGHPDEGPVAMLNLMKFREQPLDGNGTGRDAYGRYAAAAGPLVEQGGGRLVWAGSVEHAALHEGGDVDWDLGALVYYPSRGAFVDMVTSPEYMKADVDRANGLEKHVILVTGTAVANSFPSK